MEAQRGMGPVHRHIVAPGLWLPLPGRPLEPPDLSQVESVGSMFPEYPLGQGRGFTEPPAMSAGGRTSRRTRETKQQSPGRGELREQQGLIQNAVFIPHRNLSCFKFSGPALCGGWGPRGSFETQSQLRAAGGPSSGARRVDAKPHSFWKWTQVRKVFRSPETCRVIIVCDLRGTGCRIPPESLLAAHILQILISFFFSPSEHWEPVSLLIVGGWEKIKTRSPGFRPDSVTSLVSHRGSFVSHL